MRALPRGLAPRRLVPGGRQINEKTSDKTMPVARRRYAAGGQASEPSSAVACDEIINGIAKARRNYAKNRRNRKRQPKQFQHSDHSIGSQPNRIAFYQNDRPNARFRQSGLTRESRTRRRLASGESKQIAPVKAKQQVNPAIAK